MVEAMLVAKGLQFFNGKPVEAKRILQWREQIGDTAPKMTDECVEAVRRIRTLFDLRGRGTAKVATMEAQLLIEVVARNWDSR